MKLINSILGVAVCCSTIVALYAQDNYSYWPRRPQEFEQAQLLLSQQKWAEAAYVLQPFVRDADAFGSEARAVVGRVNVARYLSRMHPASSVYIVRKGDSLPKVAVKTQCPVDLLMLYNGLTEPSALKIGQKLVHIDMSLRIEIYESLNELTVWDKDVLVASYKILSRIGGASEPSGESDIKVSARESYIRGQRIPDNSSQTAVGDKLIRFSNGFVISSPKVKNKPALVLSQKDVNELAFLVKEGNTVLWK